VKETVESLRLWDAALARIPGGVNSPVRAFKAVGGSPRFIRSGRGAWLSDVDGNDYIDYVGSWGPLILGHAHPEVLGAISDALARGTSFGACTEAEVELASLIADAVPSIDKVRLVNSGTEATMSAIRAARGFTGRSDIIKVVGCYHGHADYLLVEAGSGATTFGVPTSAGVPASFVRHTLLVPYNDAQAVEDAITGSGDVACMILEPIPGNMGVVEPDDGYLRELREITQRHSVVLIFDEVMSGFRVAYGGAQERYGVVPDMTCLGKIVGGGMPVGAYGGRADILSRVAPDGPVYQAGTLSGNPLATAAGIATLRLLVEPGVYERLDALSARLAAALKRATEGVDFPTALARVGSMLCLFFADGPIRNYEDAGRADTARYGRYFQAMLDQGVYLPPAQFEAFFVSLAHGDDEIDATARAAEQALLQLDAAS